MDAAGFNSTRRYSPLTLNTEWPCMWRFLLIFSTSSTGTISNGFYIASFFVTKRLKRAGHVYLACCGLADFIISIGVFPTSGFVLLSQVWEISPVCHAVQFVTQSATYSYNLNFMMASIESYVRLCQARACYKKFITVPAGFISFMMFAISFAASGIGTYFGLDYDYCDRRSYGDFNFRLITSVTLLLIPGLCTMILFITTTLILYARSHRLAHFKKSRQYHRDYAFNILNTICYLFYVIAWAPYLVIVNKYPDATDDKFYHLAWLGLSRSIITSFIYAALNSNFRQAFALLYYYCFCKSNVTTPYNNRHRRALTTRNQTGEIRTHIIHNTRNIQRPALIGAQRDVCTSNM